MQISLRSYLTVGTAAVVGAGAIALTPALPGSTVQTAYLPAPVTAEVNLTGLNLSFTDIVGILDKFGVIDLTGLAPILNLLPTGLIDSITAEFLDQALPVVKETAGEVFNFVAATAAGLFLGKDSIPNQIIGAVAAVPGVIGAAIGELRNGNPGAALEAITSGFAAPIAVIGQVIRQAVEDFTTFMETTLGSVASQLGTVLVSAVTAVVGDQLGGSLQTVLDAIRNLFGGLSPGASVRAHALAAAPAAVTLTVGDVPAAGSEPEADSAPAALTAAARAHTPRAGASVRRAKAAAAESDPADVSEAPAPDAPDASAPQTDPETLTAPARGRGSIRAAIAAKRAERAAAHPRSSRAAR